MIRLIRVAAMLVLIAAASSRLSAQVLVRGRADRVTPGGIYPAAGVAITLQAPNGAQSLPAYVGADGMYYMYNVMPGIYTLQFWLPGMRTPFHTQRLALPPPPPGVQPMFDIAPVPLRF